MYDEYEFTEEFMRNMTRDFERDILKQIVIILKALKAKLIFWKTE